ncbi:scaffolding protein [Paenibacillus timonensis]|uniref:scaffolding protein n=1 Tax=Paenibacillus timonensis TaxID=225915 RepID=UPI003F9AAEEB
MKEYIARRFPMNLQLFAEGGEGGEDGDKGNGGGTGGEGDKKFTQAEVDKHVQTRVARAEKSAQKALAKELGFESVEAMTTALKKPEGGTAGKEGDGKGIDPAEVEKLLDERLKEREKEQNQKTFNRLLNAEVKVLANELGFADWEDARALADLSSVKENDKGELEGVKEALEALVKKKPHLLKGKQGGGSFGADVRGGGSPDDKKKALERMADLAKKEGTHAVSANDPWGR